MQCLRDIISGAGILQNQDILKRIEDLEKEIQSLKANI